MNDSLELESWIQPIRQSSLCGWWRCARFGLFRYKFCLFHKRPEFKIAANLGTIVHRLLELGPEGEAKAKEEQDARIAEIEASLEGANDPFGTQRRQLNEVMANWDKALAMANIFWEKYPPNKAFDIQGKELQITGQVQLGERESTRVWISGTLDLLTLHTATNTFWVKDIKTTSSPPEEFLVGYTYGPQKRMYRLLAAMWLGKNKKDPATPEGFILNVIQSPSIRMCGEDRPYIEEEHTITRGPRKGTVEKRKVFEEGSLPSFELYLGRVKRWYQEQHQQLGQYEPIASYMIKYEESLIPSTFAAALWAVQQKTLVPVQGLSPEQLGEEFPTDPTTSYCRKFKTTCVFYPICSQPCHAWKHIIKEHYEQKEPAIGIKEPENGPADPEAAGGPSIIVP